MSDFASDFDVKDGIKGRNGGFESRVGQKNEGEAWISMRNPP